MKDLSHISESNMLRREWDSLDEFLLDLKTKHVSIPNGTSVTGSLEWGGPPVEEAIQLAENGWPEGLSRIKNLSEKVKPIEASQADRHVIKLSESGDEVDIGRYVTNEPECMMEYEMIQVPSFGRVVKITACINATGQFSGETFFVRGAAAVTLADLIEQSGLRSEIWAIAPNIKGNFGSDFRVKIKSPDQPLELDRLAFILANQAMFRRLFFRAYEQLESSTFNTYFGVGYAASCNPKPEERGEVLVDAMNGLSGLTIETVPQFVDKMLNSFLEN